MSYVTDFLHYFWFILDCSDTIRPNCTSSDAHQAGRNRLVAPPFPPQPQTPSLALSPAVSSLSSMQSYCSPSFSAIYDKSGAAAGSSRNVHSAFNVKRNYLSCASLKSSAARITSNLANNSFFRFSRILIRSSMIQVPQVSKDNTLGQVVSFHIESRVDVAGRPRRRARFVVYSRKGG